MNNAWVYMANLTQNTYTIERHGPYVRTWPQGSGFNSRTGYPQSSIYGQTAEWIVEALQLASAGPSGANSTLAPFGRFGRVVFADALCGWHLTEGRSQRRCLLRQATVTAYMWCKPRSLRVFPR